MWRWMLCVSLESRGSTGWCHKNVHVRFKNALGEAPAPFWFGPPPKGRRCRPSLEDCNSHTLAFWSSLLQQNTRWQKADVCVFIYFCSCEDRPTWLTTWSEKQKHLQCLLLVGCSNDCSTPPPFSLFIPRTLRFTTLPVAFYSRGF